MMQRYSNIDFSTDIIKASLTNYAYDGQSEGSRAKYLSGLIALSKQPDKIRNAIFKGLADEEEDTWALVQLFDLAAIYARQGDTEAIPAIHKRFFKKIIDGSGWCGYAVILDLEGLEGLKFIAGSIGKFLEKNPDSWEDDSIIRHFQEGNPTINAFEEIEKAGRENHHIKIYLDYVKDNIKEREDYQRPVFNSDYETVRKLIDDKRTTIIRPSFIKTLSEQEIVKLADELLAEEDHFKKGKYLSIFVRTKFPYEYTPLLKLAIGRPNSKNRIVEFAVGALQFFSGEDIRQFAIEKISTMNAPWTYLSLLAKNYKTGDTKLLKAVADKYKSPEHVHSLILRFIDIYESNKTRECKLLLESMYDKLTFGVCRKEVIRILMDNDVLSVKIRKEIKYDSYEETRQL